MVSTLDLMDSLCVLSLPRHSHCHQKHLAHGRGLESGWFEKKESDLPAGGEEHVQADALLTGLPVTTAILPVADRIGLLKCPPSPWGLCCLQGRRVQAPYHGVPALSLLPRLAVAPSAPAMSSLNAAQPCVFADFLFLPINALAATPLITCKTPVNILRLHSRIPLILCCLS